MTYRNLLGGPPTRHQHNPPRATPHPPIDTKITHRNLLCGPPPPHKNWSIFPASRATLEVAKFDSQAVEGRYRQPASPPLQQRIFSAHFKKQEKGTSMAEQGTVKWFNDAT